MWWQYKPAISVCDVLDIGACFDGVLEFISKESWKIAGIPPKHSYPIAESFIEEASHATFFCNDFYGQDFGHHGMLGYGSFSGNARSNSYQCRNYSKDWSKEINCFSKMSAEDNFVNYYGCSNHRGNCRSDNYINIGLAYRKRWIR